MKDTIAAIATPLSVGGISIIRISGPEALSVADRIFLPVSGRRIDTMKGYTACYGQIQGGGKKKTEVLDDGVATVFRNPHSYTGEDTVEISCHGGLFVTREVLRAALDNGARMAEPGEFTKRAFLNGKLSLTQAEAVADLIGAVSESSMRTARSAVSGSLYKEIKKITEKLLAVSAHLAAYIDYPEEDVDELTEEDVKLIVQESTLDLERLLGRFDQGQMIKEGVDTVIIGKPNVGKSTLMNLLSGHTRSIVTDIPGTTRDVVEETVNLGSVVLRLADTAGIRETDNLVEKIGVDIALERLNSASLALVVFDLSENLTEEDRQIISRLEKETIPCVAILNKTDLPQALSEEDLRQIQCVFPHTVFLSAGGEESEQQSALDMLNDEIVSILGLSEIHPEDAMLANERQREAAAEACARLHEVLSTIQAGFTLDAVDVALESALSALFALTGEKVSDTVINEVFEKFCVGK